MSNLRLVNEDGDVLLEMSCEEWDDVRSDTKCCCDRDDTYDATKAFRKVINALTW